MMRNVKFIVVHCSAGSQRNKAADIVSFHTRSKAKGGLGWSKPGYHYIIEPDGNVVNTWPIDRSSNGVGPAINPIAINVCWIGGVDTSTKALTAVDNRTPAQKASLRSLLARLKAQFPGAIIQGHRDFSEDKNHNGIIDPWERIKECPCFEAKYEYADL